MPEKPQSPEGQDFVAPDETKEDYGISELGLEQMNEQGLHEMATTLTQEQNELATQLSAAKERFAESEENGPSGTADQEMNVWQQLQDAEKAVTRNAKQLSAVYREMNKREI